MNSGALTIRRILLAGGIVLELGTVSHAQAQTVGSGERDPIPISDSIRQAHMVHVTPHLVVLDPHTQTATFTFSNRGSTSTQADVELQYGFTDWPDTDLVNPANLHFPNPRDTVIRTPGPRDRYAGRWISGVPTHLTLKPHETRQITLRITPPANLPAGEYYTRIVTIVRPQPPKRGSSQDTKQVYHVPVQAATAGLPTLRDSIRVFYRQGLLRLGIVVRHPTTEIGTHTADARLELKDDWVRVPVQLTGNMHFEGQIQHYFRNDDTGATAVALTTRLISLQRDGVIHHWCDVPANGSLAPGHYTLVIILDATQEEFPASQRVRMQPVKITIPFELK